MFISKDNYDTIDHIVYRGKEFKIIEIVPTYNNYYFKVKLDDDNRDVFEEILDKMAMNRVRHGRSMECIFKEDYDNCQGLLPVDIDYNDRNIGRFSLDAWYRF